MNRIDIDISKFYENNKEEYLKLLLNNAECKLLNQFKEQKVLSKEQVCKIIYNEKYNSSYDSAINTFIYRFRKKIKSYYKIKTIRKGGYVLEYSKKSNNE